MIINRKKTMTPLPFPLLPPSPFGEGWGEVGVRGQINKL